MPSGIVFHVGNALALHSLHHDRSWHSLGCLRLVECSFQLIKIVAVRHIDYVEIEGLEFFIDGIRGADIRNVSINLKPIVVHNDNQIVQLPCAGKHCRLPYLAFLDLAVSKQRIDPVGFAVHLGGQRHSHSCGNPLSQGAAGHIHARDMFHIRMSLQIGS